MAAFEPVQLGPNFFFFLTNYLQKNILSNVWDEDGNAKDRNLYKLLIEEKELDQSEKVDLGQTTNYFYNSKTIFDSSVDAKKSGRYLGLFWETFQEALTSKQKLLGSNSFRDLYLPIDSKTNEYSKTSRNQIGQLALEIMVSIHDADVEKLNELQNGPADGNKDKDLMLVRTKKPGAAFGITSRKDLENQKVDGLYSSNVGGVKGQVYYSSINIGLLERIIRDDMKGIDDLGEYQEGMTAQELLQNSYKIKTKQIVKMLRDQGFSVVGEPKVSVDGFVSATVVDKKGTRMNIELSVSKPTPLKQVGIRFKFDENENKKFTITVEGLKKRGKPTVANDIFKEKQKEKASSKMPSIGSRVTGQPPVGLPPKGKQLTRSTTGAAGAASVTQKPGSAVSQKPIVPRKGRALEQDLMARRKAKVSKQGTGKAPAGGAGSESKVKPKAEKTPLKVAQKQKPNLLKALGERKSSAPQAAATSGKRKNKGRMHKIAKGILYGGLGASIAIPGIAAGGGTFFTTLFT